MNENKRFIYAKSEGGVGYAIYDNTKNYIFPNLPREYETKVFCKILNKLYVNNERLKKDNYENIDGIAFYQEENASLCEKISDLECENEQLKQSIKKVYNILQEADLFSDKATRLDIYAYSEMLKFDNKDAYTIATGIKEALKILKEEYE